MESKNFDNIDPNEIKKFSDLASRWWDKNSEFKPLHDINPLRLNFIDKISPVAGKKIIDIGCGGGILSEGLALRGADVTGIDMAEASLNVAQLHLHESGLNIDYQQCTAEEMAQHHANQFDIVCCMEMLEHVPNPSSIIKACAQLCKPGGTLFFSTINRNPKSYLFAVIGAEYVLNLLPKGTHNYSSFIQPSELAQYCRSHGLITNHTTGMTYNPLTKTYKLNDNDIDVNYILSASKPA
jgi:2-polyprenyl-6-hydroxyphenyl methylase / 3-demethylubiquinone-9 3-methyltransferase